MTERTTTRIAALLALLLTLPPVFAVEVVSRCLVTGETAPLSDRCCLVEEAPCCSDEVAASSTSATGLAGESCDCCETVVERHVPEAPSLASSDGPAHGLALPAAAPGAPIAAAVRSSRPPPPSRWARAGPGRYLLHASFRL